MADLGAGGRRNTRLPGHALRGEGAAFVPGEEDDEQEPWLRCRGHIGRGLCQCGATSNVEWSNAARRRWHLAHKAEARAAILNREQGRGTG